MTLCTQCSMNISGVVESWLVSSCWICVIGQPQTPQCDNVACATDNIIEEDT